VSPFTPIGDQARWRTVYALLTPLNVDDVLTYEQIGEALELDPSGDRHTIQMAMRRAAREYETEANRALDVVPNVGYRVVAAPEHLVLAKRQQRRAGKALARGHSKVVHVDLSSVEPEVRTAFQVVAQAFAMQMDMNRRLTGRQDKLEEAVTEIAGRSERSAAEVAELRARLERLEQQNEPRQG
jgi:hypothetical protein